MTRKKNKYPLKTRILRAINRIPMWGSDVKWWILHRFHPRHRYHIINTGLGYGWRDRDVVMEHMIVKLLIDFVELEKPFDHFEIESSSHVAEWVRLKEIYDFFKENDHFSMKPDELTPWLVEIVQLRKIMWT